MATSESGLYWYQDDNGKWIASYYEPIGKEWLSYNPDAEPEPPIDPVAPPPEEPAGNTYDENKPEGGWTWDNLPDYAQYQGNGIWYVPKLYGQRGIPIDADNYFFVSFDIVQGGPEYEPTDVCMGPGPHPAYCSENGGIPSVKPPPPPPPPPPAGYEETAPPPEEPPPGYEETAPPPEEPPPYYPFDPYFGTGKGGSGGGYSPLGEEYNMGTGKGGNTSAPPATETTTESPYDPNSSTGKGGVSNPNTSPNANPEDLLYKNPVDTQPKDNPFGPDTNSGNGVW